MVGIEFLTAEKVCYIKSLGLSSAPKLGGRGSGVLKRPWTWNATRNMLRQHQPKLLQESQSFSMAPLLFLSHGCKVCMTEQRYSHPLRKRWSLGSSCSLAFSLCPSMAGCYFGWFPWQGIFSKKAQGFHGRNRIFSLLKKFVISRVLDSPRPQSRHFKCWKGTSVKSSCTVYIFRCMCIYIYVDVHIQIYMYIRTTVHVYLYIAIMLYHMCTYTYYTCMISKYIKVYIEQSTQKHIKLGVQICFV